MAHQLHEQISSHVASTDEWGMRGKRYSIGRLSDAEIAADLVSRGHTDVEIITERVTWKGENGKRKREVISRVPVGNDAATVPTGRTFRVGNDPELTDEQNAAMARVFSGIYDALDHAATTPTDHPQSADTEQAWVCAGCGEDLRDVGMREVQSVIATSDMRYDDEADRWDYTGDSESYFDCSDHIGYECVMCTHRLSDEQSARVSFAGEVAIA